MAAGPNVTFRASGTLESELAARGTSLSAVALRDLNRYYTALESALAEAHINESDLDYLADILASSYLEPTMARYLWSEVQDAERGYAKRHNIDAANLRDRLRKLPEFAGLAIVDAIERRRHAARPADEVSIP